MRRSWQPGVIIATIGALGVGGVAIGAPRYHKPAGKDCGPPKTAGGFGGPMPTGTPKHSTPSLDVFAVRNATCATARLVFANAGSPPAGWICSSNAVTNGTRCTKGKQIVSESVIYNVRKKKH